MPPSTGFYIALGSRRLSTVVREDYKVSNEISDTKTASELRALVLERLPLVSPRAYSHPHKGVALVAFRRAQL